MINDRLVMDGEQLDLFSLDLHFEITEDQIQEALRKVIAQAKKAGNHDSFHVFNSSGHRMLDMSTTNILPELEKRGYLTLWNNGRMCHLKNEYKDWHDPAEIAAEYRSLCMDSLSRGSTFYDLHSIFLWCDGPGIREAVHEVYTEIAEQLGLAHAKEKPGALGIKINIIKKKNKKAIQAIYEGVKDLTDWRDVKQFFNSVVFELPASYCKDTMYYHQLSPSILENVCLVKRHRLTMLLGFSRILDHVNGVQAKCHISKDVRLFDARKVS